MDALNKGYTYDILETTCDIAICYDRISAYLLAHPETKGVIGMGSLATPAAGTVIKDLELKGKIIQGGFDAYLTALNNIKDGYTTFTLDDQPYMIGFIAATQMYLYLSGFFELHDYDTGMMTIDSTNVDDVLKLDFRVLK